MWAERAERESDGTVATRPDVGSAILDSVVDPGALDGARETADLEAATAPTPRPAVPPSPPDLPTSTLPAAAGEPPGRHRRSPGVWLPVAVFGVLLLAAAAVGRFVIPPDITAAPTLRPSGSTSATASGIPDGGPTTFQVDLPTPPARPADNLATWADAVARAVDVPEVAVQAYGYAQFVLSRSDPGCHLSWTTLAGVGQVESRHGRLNGAVLESNGRSTPAVVGPLLDGKEGRTLVRDTDAGAFDGDATFDRAMGPLLIMPSTWRAHATDADGDGILDPYDLDDSALALAQLLCSGPEDLAKATDWNAAMGRFHAGTAYARSVFTAADDYGKRSRGIG